MDYYLPGVPRMPKALSEDEVDKRVEEWHSMDTDLFEELGEPDLSDWLGWTEKEYRRWIRYGTMPEA